MTAIERTGDDHWLAFDSSPETWMQSHRRAQAGAEGGRRVIEAALSTQAAALSLDAASIEAIACRVAELSGGRTNPELMDVKGVARILGVAASWVYAHQEELGAIRLGDGARPRIRFSSLVVEEFMASRSASEESQRTEKPAPERKTTRQAQRPLGRKTPLLPIRGLQTAEKAP